MYYLQSRYYAPAIGRFISADAYAATYSSAVGANMFAYCSNNPVSCIDKTGRLTNWLVGGVIGGLVGGITSALQGDSFWTGAAQGAVSGAIAGAAVDAGLAILATGGLAALPIAGAIGTAFFGGAIGNIAGEETKSLLADGKLQTVDGDMIKRSALAGATNIAALGASSMLKYADEGVNTFGNNMSLKSNFKSNFSNFNSNGKFNVSDIDATSAFITTHLAFDGFIVSLFKEQ